MKILHVIRNLEIGGMERVVLALVAEQQRRGDTVAVVAVEAAAGDCYTVPAGLEVHQTTYLMGLVRRCDVVHAHNLRALRYAWLPARLQRKRLVFTKHGMTFPPGAARWLCQRPDAIAAVSRPVFDRYRQQFPYLSGRLHHIPNGIAPFEVPDRKAARAALGLSGVATLLLWVGRCVQEKGLDLLLDAFARVGADNTLLLLVGDGPERQALEQQANRLGVTGKVRFAGMQQDLAPYYAAADVFVLPSRTEGLPMALLEAGMAGLPVLVSDVGDMPAIVQKSKGGWVFAQRDAASLHQSLHAVLQSGTASLRAHGLSLKLYVSEQYGIEHIATLYEQLYS